MLDFTANFFSFFVVLVTPPPLLGCLNRAVFSQVGFLTQTHYHTYCHGDKEQRQAVTLKDERFLAKTNC